MVEFELKVSRDDYEKIIKLEEFDKERSILETSGAQHIKIVVIENDKTIDK